MSTEDDYDIVSWENKGKFTVSRKNPHSPSLDMKNHVFLRRLHYISLTRQSRNTGRAVESRCLSSRLVFETKWKVSCSCQLLINEISSSLDIEKNRLKKNFILQRLYLPTYLIYSSSNTYWIEMICQLRKWLFFHQFINSLSRNLRTECYMACVRQIV